MKKVSVRRFMEFQPADYNNRLKTHIVIEYDDNVSIRHTARELTINRHVYSLLEMYPNLPIKSTYATANFYSAGEYVSSTINKAFEAILEDIVIAYVPLGSPRDQLDQVYEKMYSILEDIYNYVVCEHLEYVSSIDIDHFLDIQMKPALLAAINEVKIKKDVDSVNNTYDVLDKLMRTEDDLEDNPIAIGYRSGGYKAAQVKQLLASRGYVTEINGDIFKYPVANSFVLGLHNIYELAVESRSGAKALFLSTRAIALSEYVARELQLITMSIEKLVDTDCGNTEYHEWYVKDIDFKNLLGKAYFEDDLMKVITTHDKHLIGKTVHIRNAMRCKLKPNKHVCAACFGRLSVNIPIHANLGMICISIPVGVLTQMILSTKHIITSAVATAIMLTGVAKDIFIIRNKDTYIFRANILNKKRTKYKLHILQEEARGLANIEKYSDIQKLNINRVTDINTMWISVEDTRDGNSEIVIPVSIGKRHGKLTYQALEYIKEHGYTLDAYDRYVIDLTDWKVGTPLLTLPQIEFSYIDLVAVVKDEFKYMKTRYATPEAFLHRIYEIFNSKLDVNLAMLEVIASAFMVEDADNGKYGMGRGGDTNTPTKIGNILTNRSLGGAFAWEHTLKTIYTPSSFYGRNAIDHPLDVMLKPREVLAGIKKS